VTRIVSVSLGQNRPLAVWPEVASAGVWLVFAADRTVTGCAPVHTAPSRCVARVVQAVRSGAGGVWRARDAERVAVAGLRDAAASWCM